MRHPSIRIRLMVGTGLFAALALLIANIFIYRTFEHNLSNEIERQLLQSSSLLAKSAELEATSLDYEWQEAMKSSNAPEITGMFQFFDVNRKLITKSPDLGHSELPVFHGKINVPVTRDIVLGDGRRARAVGLLHYPFTDDAAIAEASKIGVVLKPEDHPQVLVCAQETETLHRRLDDLKLLLIRAAVGTLIVIWAAIIAISTWCLRPLREFGASLMERSEHETATAAPVPRGLPSELVGLATAFNITLDRVTKSRAREKEFALHAAHELRTPVAGILVTLEQALKRERSKEELKRRMGEALEITFGMRATLNGLMRLARLRGGMEQSVRSSFDPSDVVRELIDGAQEIARQRGLRIHAEMPLSIAALSADPGLFKALISNLIDNAIRHCPRDTDLFFTIRDQAERFEFETRNACGDLQPDQLERLFQPFQRGSDAADDEGGHAGLGLSLAKEAALILGGSLDAVIENDRTIVFRARLQR